MHTTLATPHQRGRAGWVVVACESERQERNWRRVAARYAEVPVATGVVRAAPQTHRPTWRPLHGMVAPVRLVDLASQPIPAASVARVETGGGHPSRYVVEDAARWWSAR